MAKNIKKTLATSLTSIFFIIVGITGIMLYFHFLEIYIHEMHAILGLIFVIIILFHIYYNFNSMKKYFTEDIFRILLITMSIVVISFIYTSSPKNESIKREIILAVLKLPITDAINILGGDMKTAKLKLKLINYNIKVDDKTSIIQIAKEKKISPLKIVNIIVSKK